MKIVDLVRGDSLSPKQGKSYVSESALLGGARGPVLALHHSIVGGRTAKCDPIPLVIGADSGEGAAAGHLTFEMVNVGRFEVRTRRLIVAAILVQPGNWIRIRAAVRGHRSFVPERVLGRRNCKWKKRQSTAFRISLRLQIGQDLVRFISPSD